LGEGKGRKKVFICPIPTAGKAPSGFSSWGVGRLSCGGLEGGRDATLIERERKDPSPYLYAIQRKGGKIDDLLT